jgi:hypothetical protein
MLTNGQYYYYKITAINTVGESAFSVELSAMPTAIPSIARPNSTVIGLNIATGLLTLFGIIGSVVIISIPIGRYYNKIRKARGK